MRAEMNMDLEWDFFRGDLPCENQNSHFASYNSVKSGGATGLAAVCADTSICKTVDLPHDYLTESGFSEDYLHSHGYKERCNGWYRKTFLIPKALKDKQLFICFEGTSVNAEFYFNGSLISRSFSAYAETFFDITERAYFDGRLNVLAVYIKGNETEGWWYEGAGIYRHVKLYAKEKVHISHNGIFAKPTVISTKDNSWEVKIAVEVENSDYIPQTVKVKAEILDGNRLISENCSEPLNIDFKSVSISKQSIKIDNPRLWDIDSPNLYTVKISLINGKNTIDTDSVKTGFRTVEINKDTGFWLNGKNIKIKGACNHQDHAGVGVAVPDSVQYFRIKRLKDMGINAYRCAHNLPAKEILNACDELGLIVMDENRRFEASEYVLNCVEQMVKRDRNHPSVVFWSLFNEEPLQNTEEGRRIFKRMKSVVEHLDDSRFITGAINGTPEGAGLEMDITGINYNIKRLPEFHTLYPNQPLIGSENNSAISTRGCYLSDYEKHILNNYDEEIVPWGQTVRETWKFVCDNPWYAGIFIWTGFDYRGEPSPFKWPSVSSQFGVMDLCGFSKDAYYYNKACFTDTPMVHILPHWNWNPGEKVRVVAVNNCDEIELFLNNKSLGKKKSTVFSPPEWTVEFNPGKIEAKGYKNGVCVACDAKQTAENPSQIIIKPVSKTVNDSGQDAMILNIYIKDKNGITACNADNAINIEVSGDAVLLGMGNGDPNSHEPDNISKRKAYNGKCQAIVKALPNARSIKIKAFGDNLSDGIFIPEIIHINPPNYIHSKKIYQLSGVTATAVTPSRPNPLFKVSDDDMNTLNPINLEKYPNEYKNGYMIYRAFATLPRHSSDANLQKPYSLCLKSIRADGVELYVNEELVLENYKLAGNTISDFAVHFSGNYKEKVEIRILTFLSKEREQFSGGVLGPITITDNIS